MFNSMEEEFPWLAVDLLTPHKVVKVEIVERSDCCAERTHDIEVRVGQDKPPERLTGGDTLINNNVICGFFKGPGVLGSISTIVCSTPLIGRYITLQNIEKTTMSQFNWPEVLIDSSPAEAEEEGEKIEILLTENAAGQCSSSYPYAFRGGDRCCRRNLEVDPTDKNRKMEPPGSYGFLNFDSTQCGGNSWQYCTTPPCMNYQYQRYGCYMEGASFDGSVLESSSTDTADECQERALQLRKQNQAADGFTWNMSDKSCDIMTGPTSFSQASLNNLAAKLPCP